MKHLHIYFCSAAVNDGFTVEVAVIVVGSGGVTPNTLVYSKIVLLLPLLLLLFVVFDFVVVFCGEMPGPMLTLGQSYVLLRL